MRKMCCILKKILLLIPLIKRYKEFIENSYYASSLKDYILFHIGKKGYLYWPRVKSNIVSGADNIIVGKNCCIDSPGCYIQGGGRLVFGDYVRVATNCGIMSGNHNPLNHGEKIAKETVLGSYTWIGMNSVILPGVVLGKRTVVGAGSVVTKSFPEGFCIIAGNPARKVKDLDPEKFVEFKHSKYDFYGYVPANQFERYRKKKLSKVQNELFERSFIKDHI